jgi:hypothetical protein
VYHFEFAPDSSALAFLYDYSDNRGPGQGHGKMGVAALPDGAMKPLGERVPNFEWGADGRYVAFVSRFFKPIYSVDLMLYRFGDEAAKKVQEGVYGYEFSAKNAYLLMRTRCIRDGRSCELHGLDLSKADQTPKKLLEGVYSFKASADPNRVIATYARMDVQLYDAMAVNIATGQHRTLDTRVQIPVLLAADDGSKVAYIVAEKRRAGVYLATGVP